MKLQNKVAVITGGNSGMGKVTSIMFSKNGAKVVIVDVSEGTTANEIKESGGIAEYIKADVSNENEVEMTIQKITNIFGRIDILLNFAGIMSGGLITNITVEQWDRMMAINVRGIFLMCKWVLPVMVDQGKGKIVNISSMAAIGATPLIPEYTAAKGAVSALTRQLVCDFGPKGININAICPGTIRTPMLEQFYANDPTAKSRIESKTPYVRLGSPEDVANVAMFLSTEDADFISGVNIPVDGGRTALA